MLPTFCYQISPHDLEIPGAIDGVQSGAAWGMWVMSAQCYWMATYSQNAVLVIVLVMDLQDSDSLLINEAQREILCPSLSFDPIYFITLFWDKIGVEEAQSDHTSLKKKTYNWKHSPEKFHFKKKQKQTSYDWWFSTSRSLLSPSHSKTSLGGQEWLQPCSPFCFSALLLKLLPTAE